MSIQKKSRPQSLSSPHLALAAVSSDHHIQDVQHRTMMSEESFGLPFCVHYISCMAARLQPNRPLVTHRLALTIQSLAYHWCAVSIYFGIGPSIPSCFVAELKNVLFNPSSTSLRSLSTSAYMTNRPSLFLPAWFLGESPHRTVMEVGVFSTTSK